MIPHWKKTKHRHYLAETIKDADYAEDLALLANSPTQGESRLHRMKQAARGISLYVNADKTEFMCFTQEGSISTEIRRPGHIFQQQYLIYWKRGQYKHREDMDSSWQVDNHVEIWSLIKLNRISSICVNASTTIL